MAATANNARTIFSPSPTHFDVSDDALMLKKVEFDWDAMHLPTIVLPVPGGPNSRMPRGGRRKPVNISGRRIGQTTASFIVVLAYSKPAISSQSKRQNCEINQSKLKILEIL